MRIPDSLATLADEGIIDEVLRPLMSGKEAQVYLLRVGDDQRVAKVYKKSQDRTFKHRAEYTEGRKVRNTRDQRAMAKLSRYGREKEEAAWRATEVDMIYRMRAAGVRVPTPYQFIDGVLIMELISDGEGNPAPRLGDVDLDRAHAEQIYDQLLREVVKMLCAGVVHGDLSDFNVLLAPDGPVIIDFPQAVNASSGQNARKLLLRDVDNLHRFLTRFAPERRPLPYAEEMWQLYQRGELTPDVRLSGRYRAAEGKVDTDGVLMTIADADRDERRRRTQMGQSMRGMAQPAGERRERNASPAQRERPAPMQSSHTRDPGRHASTNHHPHRSRDTSRTTGQTVVQVRRAPPDPKQPPFPQRRAASAADGTHATATPPFQQRRTAAADGTRVAADPSITQPRKRRRRRRKASRA